MFLLSLGDLQNGDLFAILENYTAVENLC